MLKVINDCNDHDPVTCLLCRTVSKRLNSSLGNIFVANNNIVNRGKIQQKTQTR